MLRRSFLGTTAALLAVGCVPAEDPSTPRVSAGGTSLVLGSRPRVVGPSGASLEIEAARHLVVRFDADGSVTATMGGLGTEVGALNGPAQVGFAPNGDAWVLDRGNGRVQRFDPAGFPVAVLEAPDATALAIGADGTLALGEATRGQVRIVGEDGSLVRVVELGAVPRDVAWAPDGQLVVLTYAGGLVRSGPRTFDTLLSPGSLAFPLGVAVADDGRIFVAEAGAFALRVLAADGSTIEAVRSVLDDGRLAQPVQVSAHGSVALVTMVPGPREA
ncbi:MAG: hypothetical protein R3F61_22605 [Myxococcota bacterium]